LNGDDQRRPAPALKELYSKPRRSSAWESEQADVIRFWTDDGDSWGFLFHYLTAIHYSARHERLLITWTLGTLVIAGPKVLEFYDDFCNRRATFQRNPSLGQSAICQEKGPSKFLRSYPYFRIADVSWEKTPCFAGSYLRDVELYASVRLNGFGHDSGVDKRADERRRS
jgi:hypothetical protein